MILDKESDGSFQVIGKHSNFKSQGITIETNGIVDNRWDFQSTEVFSGAIGSMVGSIRRDVARSWNCSIFRELFLSEDEQTTGIRVSIENNSLKPCTLGKVIPISIVEESEFSVGDTLFANWEIARMARNKNDIPGCFKPGLEDQDFEDASLDSSEIPAGAGVSEADSVQHTNSNKIIISEPCMFIRNQNEINIPGLFISVLGQDKHLTQLALSSNIEDNSLKSFEIIYEFDGVEVESGEIRETHWALFREEQNYHKATEKHNEMLAEMYKASEPAFAAPSIYCTWYFYGHDFNENDLDETLYELEKDKVPFDIFLLDDGWSDKFGSWQGGERFPSGMKNAAKKIESAGYLPGIWTCPFVVMADSDVVKEHPELLARNPDGTPYRFAYNGPVCYAVDPTSTYAESYFNSYYKRLRDWGFKVHKFDFLRSILTTDQIRFHNKKFNRAQAYRLGMELVRKAIGSESYILACGGLFEGSIGLVDGMRTGSDTRGYWQQPEYLTSIKQNIMRNNSNRFWHTDPDAVMLRLRSERFRDNQTVFGELALGNFNDEEAFTVVVNQYLGGGMTCISERFAELQPERRAMLRHIIPATFPVPKTIDMFNPGCPTIFLSKINPVCKKLGQWWTLAVANWKQEPVMRIIKMSELNLPSNISYILFEFKEQKSYGIKTSNDFFELKIPAHGMRLIRITPWDGEKPVIIGTDLHLTGGAVELKDVIIEDRCVSGEIGTKWSYPVKITAAFPEKNGVVTKTATVKNKIFSIKFC